MDRQKLAAALLEGAAGGTRPCPEQADGLDEDGAYAVQEELVRLWQGRGTGCAGYKVALTSAILQERFGTDEPAYGRVLDSFCFADGKELTIPEGMAVRVECELALVLGRDVTQIPAGREELLACVAYGLPAFEIVASRYTRPHTSVPKLIADNGNFMAAVLGDVPVDIGGLESDLLGLRLEVDGRLRASGVSAAVLGDPLNALDWLARKLLRQGNCLRRGEIVLTGAFAPPEQAQPGSHFRADFDGLGGVSVLFAGKD